uniref:Nesprin-1 spectrin repeats region domain-containing protein n=1 Tax=Oryzias melastigma TaxID=30732 RepID=A0A3B3D5A7_ORYME
IQLEFWEMKYRLTAFLLLAESKLKSWIIKYGRRESVELLLRSYLTFTEGQRFFEQYEVIFTALQQAADVYVKSERSVDEAEGVSKFLADAAVQWRNLALEVRSVRSMLEEVICNWEKYSGTVAALQAYLEDAEQVLGQSESIKRDFFRNLSHWIQQHTDMNDAGNFLIETCDETVSRDLKQQLLLLNGRHEHPEDVPGRHRREDERRRAVPAMEAACRAAGRTAQLLSKDAPQEELLQMTAVMASIKEQLSKVSGCPPLLREAQALLPPLEEMEKNISGFYQALEKAGAITGSSQPGGGSDFRQKCQELATFTHSCRKCLTVIERNHQSVQRSVSGSAALHHLDLALLQRRVAELQTASQNMIRESTEWRRHEEANSDLLGRFEESRVELEKVLKSAHSCMTERGEPEDLLRKHTDFFEQLDQRVLNSFLKACDELTDILPEQEQQALQETVRKLHKRWKDMQTDVPLHLLRLQVEAERSRLELSLQECQAELTRENRHLVGVGSERLLKEHRSFFREKGPLSLCEKRLQLMEELCQKLPEEDSAHRSLQSAKKEFGEVQTEVQSTRLKLLQHQDKWKDYNKRYAELSCWLISKESQLRLLRNRASDPKKYSQVKTAIMELRNEAELQEGNLGWLKGRMADLIEVSADEDAQRQGGALAKLSADFKGLVASLSEAEKMLLTMGDCVQFREEVQTTLEDLVQSQKEVQAEASQILDSSDPREAQQLLLAHQVLLDSQSLREAERGQQLQVEEGLGGAVQQDLQMLENSLSRMEQSADSQEQSLEAFVLRARSSVDRDLNFSSPESLEVELDQARVTEALHTKTLLKRAAEIQLSPQNRTLLGQQAHGLREQVEQVEARLKQE